MPIPTKDSALLSFATNFQDVTSTVPANWGLLAADATLLGTQVAAFASALTVATTPATRTKITVAQKDTAKAAMLVTLRGQVKRVQAFPGVTLAMREEAGLQPYNPPSPQPAPASAPVLTVVAVLSNRQTIRIADQFTPTKRAKPFGVTCAQIFTYLTAGPDELPPANIDAWTGQGTVARSGFTLEYPESAAGKTAWIVARWQNSKCQTGPLSTRATAIVLGPSSGLTLAA